ncbi:MAG: hypothetical protein ABI858_03950 [Pseudoxanthomonas sp.]
MHENRRMTATHKGIWYMAKKSASADPSEDAFIPCAQTRLAHQSAEENALTRPGKTRVLHWLKMRQRLVLRRSDVLADVAGTQSLMGVWPASFTVASHQDKEISCWLS